MQGSPGGVLTIPVPFLSDWRSKVCMSGIKVGDPGVVFSLSLSPFFFYFLLGEINSPPRDQYAMFRT